MKATRGLLIAALCLTGSAQAASTGWQRDDASLDQALQLQRAQGLYAALAGQWQQLPNNNADPVIRLYRLLTAGLTDRAIAAHSSLPDEARTPAMQLAIADALYRDERYQEAQAALDRMRIESDTPLTLARNERLARIGIRLGQFDDAALPLADAQQRIPLQPLQRYNLGIAWLGAGDDNRGAVELNWVGTQQDPGAGAAQIEPYLADRANLSLGFWLLDQNRNAAAAQVLRRVHIDSPVAAQAMLGLGWAEFHQDETGQVLTPSSRQECRPVDAHLWAQSEALHSTSRQICNTAEIAAENKGLGQLPGYANADSGYRRAASMWQNITAGDARNVLVAEALANLPHALAKAGDRFAAQVAAKQAAKRIQQAIADLRDGRDSQPLAVQSGRQVRLRDESAFLQRALEGLRNEPVPADPVLTAVGKVLKALNSPSGMTRATPAQRGLLLYFVSRNSADKSSTPRVDNGLAGRRAALAGRITRLLENIQQMQTRLAVESREARIRHLEHHEAAVRVFLASLQSRS